ncbi:MAG: rhomboid family intramembrane serine protease [Acidimicrobiales bacterium]
MISPADRCYRHADRPAAVGCQRCDRPICSLCMQQASVGFHCPECAKKGAQKVSPGIPRGSRGRRAVPAAVATLIAINVVVLIAELVSAGSTDVNNGIARDGWLWGPAVDLRNEYYRIITSGFMHADLLHLAMNMYGFLAFSARSSTNYLVEPDSSRST